MQAVARFGQGWNRYSGCPAVSGNPSDRLQRGEQGNQAIAQEMRYIESSSQANETS